MAQKITWMPNAREDFRDIIHYLANEWGNTFAEEFTERVSKQLELIENHLFIGKQNEQFSSIRQLPVTKNYILYYLVLHEEIIIVNLLHTNRKR
ncbi:MAG: type II toxin-antitoxin system RelE/ParE family toxin [Cytophagaceae bacterium]|nr:type II toxin-antitoxin system RelE/ParE family toxin [Cytophagaceae bacterium]